MYEKILNIIRTKFEKSFIEYDKSMKEFTSIKIGGTPEAILVIQDIDELILCLKFLKNADVKTVFIGKGTNLLFTDDLNKYIVLKFGENFNKIVIENNILKCFAATPLQQLVRKTAEVGLTGLEWAMGIPGTVGGAVVNNAGTSNITVNEFVKEITLIDYSGNIKKVEPEYLNLKYRNSKIKEHKNEIIIEILFELKKDDRVSILTRLNNYFKLKQETQPLDMFSAGCIFKNVNNESSAGKLIDQCGLKGYKIGGLKVSEIHANYFVNEDNATYNDFIQLMEYVKNEVYKKFNIKLETEVEVIGNK